MAGVDRIVTILDPLTHNEVKRPIYEVASSHLARRTFIGNIYKKVKDPNLVSALSGHKEGSKAFRRYRDIDEEMKKDLVKLSAQSHASIASSLREAVDKYIVDGERTVVTDIHLQPKQDSGELVIFNDDDEELSRTIIEEWVDYSEDDFYTIVERILRGEINALKDTGVLDKLAIMKPYSFVLVDEDRETVTELLLIDDEDTLLLNDELLKGLDEELDAFLKDLLEK